MRAVGLKVQFLSELHSRELLGFFVFPSLNLYLKWGILLKVRILKYTFQGKTTEKDCKLCASYPRFGFCKIPLSASVINFDAKAG